MILERRWMLWKSCGTYWVECAGKPKCFTRGTYSGSLFLLDDDAWQQAVRTAQYRQLWAVGFFRWHVGRAMRTLPILDDASADYHARM